MFIIPKLLVWRPLLPYLTLLSCLRCCPPRLLLHIFCAPSVDLQFFILPLFFMIHCYNQRPNDSQSKTTLPCYQYAYNQDAIYKIWINRTRYKFYYLSTYNIFLQSCSHNLKYLTFSIIIFVCLLWDQLTEWNVNIVVNVIIVTFFGNNFPLIYSGLVRHGPLLLCASECTWWSSISYWKRVTR